MSERAAFHPILLIIFFLLPLFGKGQWHEEERTLCDPVQKKRWNEVGPVMGPFLDSLEYGEERGGKQGRQRRLSKIKKWLEAQPCVKKAELQAGTVKKRIPQKEILVVFLFNGNERIMMLRIALDAPYSFAGIYKKER